MSDLRKRILTGGIAAICAILLLQDESPPLGALLAWCGIWVFLLLSFPSTWDRRLKQLLILLSAVLIVSAFLYSFARAWEAGTERTELMRRCEGLLEIGKAYQWKASQNGELNTDTVLQEYRKARMKEGLTR